MEPLMPLARLLTPLFDYPSPGKMSEAVTTMVSGSARVTCDRAQMMYCSWSTDSVMAAAFAVLAAVAPPGPDGDDVVAEEPAAGLPPQVLAVATRGAHQTPATPQGLTSSCTNG